MLQTDICEVCPNPLVLSQQLTHIELERLSMIGPEEFIEAFTVEKKLSVSSPIDIVMPFRSGFVYNQCSQRIYLLRMLRSQGLSSGQLHTVFVSLVVATILYALPAWGVFASVGQIGRIDAFLRRAYKCGISKDLFTFQDLLHDSGAILFRKMQS